MAFTQADLDAIDQAIASGVLSVQFADRLTMYRSVGELQRARATILAELNTRPRMTLAVANKGFNQ